MVFLPLGGVGDGVMEVGEREDDWECILFLRLDK